MSVVGAPEKNCAVLTSGDRRDRADLAWLSLLAILLGGSASRLCGIAVRSLWFDEAFSWRMASFSATDVFVRSAADNNPPLYYLILKLWMAAVGESAVSLRCLSVCGGVVTCLGAYFLAGEAYDSAGTPRSGTSPRKKFSSLGVCAAALIAVSTYQIRWSWEARMYSLGAALAVWSSWLLLRALHAERLDYGRWMLYAFTALAFLYIHTYAVFSVAAQWLFVVGWFLVRGGVAAQGAATQVRAQRPPCRGALLAAALIVVAWAPWCAVLKDQAAHVRQAFWSQPLDRWDVPYLCYKMFVEPENPTFDDTTCLAVAGACAAVILQLLWRPKEGDWLVFLMAVTPILGGVLVSSAVANVVHPRYLVFAHVFLLIALARLLGRIPREPERSIVAGVVLANMVIIHVVFWRSLEVGECPGVRAAAQYIDERRQGDASVLVASPFFFTPVLYHLTDRTNCYLVNSGQGFVHYQGTAALKPDDFFSADRLSSLPAGQLWVVNNRSGGWPSSEVAVPNGWEKIGHRTFREPYRVQGTVEVVEYRVR